MLCATEKSFTGCDIPGRMRQDPSRIVGIACAGMAPRRHQGPLMQQQHSPRPLWLALGALFLLNLSTLGLYALSAGMAYEYGALQEGFTWGALVNEIPSSPILFSIVAGLVATSVYFWFRKQNWRTCACLVLAGIGVNFIYFSFYLSLYFVLAGILSGLVLCGLLARIFKWRPRLTSLPGCTAARLWLKQHPALRRSLIAALVMVMGFEIVNCFYEIPLFARPLPYNLSGWGWRGRQPPYAYDLTIEIDDLKENYSAADLAATCKAAANYFVWEYGLPSLDLTIVNKPNKKEYPYLIATLATCSCGPKKEAPKEWEWSRFTVTSWHSEKEAREFDRRLEAANPYDLNYDRDALFTRVARSMGYRESDTLEYPDLKPVAMSLLPDDLFERPLHSRFGKQTEMTRGELPEASRELYQFLVSIGNTPAFPACLERESATEACTRWRTLRKNFNERLKGNFSAAIAPFETALTALEKAFAERNEAAVKRLEARLESILTELQREMEKLPSR